MTVEKGDIFSARWIIEDAFHSHSDCAMYVLNGRICDLAPLAALEKRYPNAAVHDAPNTAILPGFVNAHHHCYGVNLINQGINDDLLEPWIAASAGAAQISPHDATKYAALQLLRSGVTAVVDVCSAGQTVTQVEAKVRGKIDIYQGFGISCAIAPGERWKNHIVHPDGESPSFLATLPEDLRNRLAHQHIERERVDPKSYLCVLTRLHDEFAGSENADVWFGPIAPHWTVSETLQQIAVAVRDTGQRVQTHAEESRLQHLMSTHPKIPAAIAELDQAGLLSDGLSLAHMVWANGSDLARVAEAGAHIVCNPSSNLRLRSGIAPVPMMKRLGINLALGTDGTSLAGDEDMFAEMRLAKNLYWAGDPTHPSLSPQDVFDMATLGGARLMGIDNSIGSLTVGKRADFMILRLDRIMGPWLARDVDPIELLVSAAKASDIQSVYTGGQLAVADGDVVKCDEHAILQKISDDMQHAADRRLSGRDYATVRAAMLRWYETWLAKTPLGMK